MHTSDTIEAMSIFDPKKPHVDLVYELKGGNVVDVFELAPALLAWGEMIQESHRALHPDGHEIAVNVRPFREGSFIVDIVLFPTVVENLLSVLRTVSVEQVLETIKILGAAGGLATSAIGVIRALRGKVKEIDKIGPNEYRYESDDNSVTVTGSANQILQNSNIVQNIVNVYARPIEEGGHDQVRSYLKGETDETKIVTIKKDEALAIKQFALGAPVDAEGERIVETEREVYLNPKRGSFGGDGVGWSFWNGEKPIKATVRDETFLRKHETGEIRLNHADLLRVRLLEKQRITGTAVRSATYEILEVLEYTEGPRQQRLSPITHSVDLRDERETIDADYEPPELA